MPFDRSDDTVRICVGSIFMVVGSLWFLPACFPRLRTPWNNGIVSGRATFTGIGIFISGLGAALFSSGYAPLESYILVFVILGLCGWVLTAIGFVRDKRLHAALPNRPVQKDEAKQKVFPPRLAGLIIALFLGDFLYVRAEEAWTNYWLMTDGQSGMAVVTKESLSGHNQVGYTYYVNHAAYTGKSRRDWQDPKYANVQIGDKSVVYYSASHPWISRLYRPGTLVTAWPVILIVLVLEFFAVATIINPKSKWAFNINPKKNVGG